MRNTTNTVRRECVLPQVRWVESAYYQKGESAYYINTVRRECVPPKRRCVESA